MARAAPALHVSVRRSSRVPATLWRERDMTERDREGQAETPGARCGMGWRWSGVKCNGGSRVAPTAHLYTASWRWLERAGATAGS